DTADGPQGSPDRARRARPRPPQRRGGRADSAAARLPAARARRLHARSCRIQPGPRRSRRARLRGRRSRRRPPARAPRDPRGNATAASRPTPCGLESSAKGTYEKGSEMGVLVFVVAAAVVVALLGVVLATSLRYIGPTDLGLVTKRFGRRLSAGNVIAMNG